LTAAAIGGSATQSQYGGWNACRLEEGEEPHRTGDRAEHVGADLDAGEPQLAHVVEGGDGGVDVLQGHDAQPHQAVGRRSGHRRHRLVQAATELAPEVGLGPVAEQLGHDRDRLHRDPAHVHRRDPGVDVPRLARDGAEVRAPDEHVGGVAVLHERSEPVVVPERQAVRDDVGVDVDDRRARGHGFPLSDDHLGTYLKVWSTR
jgi:hypothetical protein